MMMEVGGDDGWLARQFSAAACDMEVANTIRDPDARLALERHATNRFWMAVGAASEGTFGEVDAPVFRDE